MAFSSPHLMGDFAYQIARPQGKCYCVNITITKTTSQSIKHGQPWHTPTSGLTWLLTLRLTGEALDVVTQRVRLDASFRPKSANATFQIAQLAARGGGASGVARVLLKDFGTRFPDDPHVEAAGALLRHLGD